MRPSPASLGFYVVAYASSPLAQKKALKEGNKREEEEGGGVEVLRSATVRAATANPNPNPNLTPTPPPHQVRAATATQQPWQLCAAAAALGLPWWGAAL